MKISTIIIGILVLAGCATTGYMMLSSHKAPPVARDPVVAASPVPPPPSTASVRRVPIEERLIREPAGAGPSTQRKSEMEIINASLFSASMAFAVREEANIDEDIKAQLLVNPASDLDKLEKQLNVTGKVTSGKIKVSRIVKATLTAPDFDVKAITEEEQFITDNEATEWLWTLSPKSAGTFDVHLSVTAIVNLNGRESRHNLKTFEKTVKIEITQKQIIQKWFDENYKWVVGSLLLPLIGFLFKEFLYERIKNLFVKKRKTNQR